MELYKDKRPGKKRRLPNCRFAPEPKGYHLHRVRAARYVAIKENENYYLRATGWQWVKSETVLKPAWPNGC